MLAYTVKLDVKSCHLLYPQSNYSKDVSGDYYEITHYNNLAISRIYYHRLPTMILDFKEDLSDLIKKHEIALKTELSRFICE